MKIYTPIGSKTRLFEMMQNVNKVKLNENAYDVGTQNNILETEFNKLIQGQLKVKQSNTQTNGDKTFVELDCNDENNNNVKFRFELSSSEGDQEGIFNVNAATMSNFTFIDASGGNNIEIIDDGLREFNAEHSDDILNVASDNADFETKEPEIDEAFLEAAKKIDSYPFGGTPRTMQTSRSYADQKPTNPKLRVKAPELEKIVDEELITTPYSINIPERKRKMILTAVDNLRKKGENGFRKFTTKEINAEVQKIKNLRLSDIDEEFIGATDSKSPVGSTSNSDNSSDDKRLAIKSAIESLKKVYPYHTFNAKQVYDEIKRMKREAKNIKEEINILEPKAGDYNTGGLEKYDDIPQKAFNNLPQNNKNEIIEQAIDYVNDQLEKMGTSREQMPRDQYTAYIRKIAQIMFEKDQMRMNEEKDEYPDPIGKKFKAKSTYPKPRKKPQTTVKLDEINIKPEKQAEKQAKSDISKQYPFGGNNIHGSSSEKWTKRPLPYNTKFTNPDDPSNIEFSDLREEEDTGMKFNPESDEIEQLAREKEETGEVLQGGKGDDKSALEFNPEQVLLGLKVEADTPGIS